jgi:hypothetical protein
VSASRPGRSLPPGKGPVPTVQEARWAPGSALDRRGKFRPHRDSIPDRPAHSQPLYRLSYPALCCHCRGLLKSPGTNWSKYFIFSHSVTFFFLYVFFFRVSLSFHTPLSSDGYILRNFTRNYQITLRHIFWDGSPLLIATASTSSLTKYSRDHDDSRHQDQGAVNSADNVQFPRSSLAHCLT